MFKTVSTIVGRCNSKCIGLTPKGTHIIPIQSYKRGNVKETLFDFDLSERFKNGCHQRTNGNKHFGRDADDGRKGTKTEREKEGHSDGGIVLTEAAQKSKRTDLRKGRKKRDASRGGIFLQAWHVCVCVRLLSMQ